MIDYTSMVSDIKIAADKTAKLGITLPKSIVQKIDKQRGDIARSRYIRRAIENYLSNSTTLATTTTTTKSKKRKYKQK
jgi:metal-responsive CopG/Arc/MetJ family transcriptional regulator